RNGAGSNRAFGRDHARAGDTGPSRTHQTRRTPIACTGREARAADSTGSDDGHDAAGNDSCGNALGGEAADIADRAGSGTKAGVTAAARYDPRHSAERAIRDQARYASA